MKKELIEILDKWPKYYINSNDLKPFLNCSYGSLHSLIKRAVKEGLLIRLRRDFYLIAKKTQDIKPQAFEIASLLYGPSYISFESALSFYEWIPESVPATISASSKKSKKYTTEIGSFIYYNIPVSVFHIGITSFHNHTKNNSTFIIADPWKAIADLIYIKKRSWVNVIAFSNDLRIELDILQNSDLNLLEILSKTYPSKRTQKTLKILYKDLSV